jgi:hypothetical protein
LFNPNENVEQPTQPSAYDKYMQTATDIYNKNVESNRKASANQASAVGAEYRELQRNVNEINKANGRANTGYAGDTSIEGYNAYRNSLNQIYSQRDKNENDLYSYYIDSILKTQQAKENSELAQKQMKITEDANQLEKDKYVSTQITAFLNNDESRDNAGKIKSDYADKVRNYIEEYYGSYENAPASIKFELSSYPGFNDYLNAYNNDGTYGNTEVKYNQLSGISNSNEIVSADEQGAKQFAVLDGGKASGSTQIRSEVGQNNFTVSIDGVPYRLETGKLSERLEGDIADKLREQIKNAKGREAKQYDLVYYNGNIYVVGNDDKTLCKVQARDGTELTNEYNNFVKKVYEKLGLSYETAQPTTQQSDFKPGYATGKGKFKYK